MKPVLALLRIVFATLSNYLFAYLLTALGVLVGCVGALIGRQSFIRAATVAWAHLLFLIVGRRLHVRGRENIAPGMSYIVVANHSSMYDIPALMGAVPGVAIMGRDYLMRIPGFGRLLKILHYVPIDTTSARGAREALDQAARVARKGISVGIFPEGTRTETGHVQALKRGFVHVLRASGRDLLPVSIRGTFALKPKGRMTMDPRERIEVSVGAPVANAELAELPDDEVMRRVRSILEDMEGDGNEAD